eukprot:13477-Heterococcus_DN1.PRE.2
MHGSGYSSANMTNVGHQVSSSCCNTAASTGSQIASVIEASQQTAVHCQRCAGLCVSPRQCELRPGVPSALHVHPCCCCRQVAPEGVVLRCGCARVHQFAASVSTVRNAIIDDSMLSQHQSTSKRAVVALFTQLCANGAVMIASSASMAALPSAPSISSSMMQLGRASPNRDWFSIARITCTQQQQCCATIVKYNNGKQRSSAGADRTAGVLHSDTVLKVMKSGRASVDCDRFADVVLYTLIQLLSIV